MTVDFGKDRRVTLTKGGTPEGDPLTRIIMKLSWGNNTPDAPNEDKWARRRRRLMQIVEIAVEISLSAFGGDDWGDDSFDDETDEVEEIDLDASCLALGADLNLVEPIWFNQLTGGDGSIRHSGDDLTGGGSETEDNETLTVDLRHVPAHIQHLVFTINAYRGRFTDVDYATCSLVDISNGPAVELGSFRLTKFTKKRGLIMAIVSRTNSGWEARRIGRPGPGRTCQKLLPLAQQILSEPAA